MGTDNDGNAGAIALIRWVLLILPLIGLVFTAGGGWFMLAALQDEHDELKRSVSAHLIERSRDEQRLTGLEADAKRTGTSVTAVCIATGAKCPGL